MFNSIPPPLRISVIIIIFLNHLIPSEDCGKGDAGRGK